MNPYIANSLSVARNAIDGATRRVEGASSSRLAWGGLALAALTFLAFNLISQNALRGWKADATADGLYTISDGTRKALKAIDEPIDLNVYFSKKLGDAAPAYAKTFERVRTLLEQYRSMAGSNKLRITYYDPEPFSDAEDRAVAAGLRGIRLNQDGDQAYFGITGTNSTDNEANIPFFAQERERFVEYDVTKLVYSLANPKKKAIGLLSTVNLEGGMDPQMGMRGRPTPPQMILDQIREVFDIKTIDKDTKEIAKDLDVLMLVQPDGLTPETVYAIDQFVLRGGKILAFVDPVAESSRQPGPMGLMGGGSLRLGDMEKVLKAWGVAFDGSKVAGDIQHARRVQFGGARGGQVTEYVAWIGLDKRNLDAKDVLSASIEKINLGTPGFFTKAEGATTTFAPILSTSPRAMQIAAERVSMMPDAVALLRGYKAEGKALAVAARVSGEVKSAFPDGAPKAAAKDDTKPDEKKLDEAAAAKKDDKAVATPIPATPHLASGRLNAILIADSDILNDQFWVDIREFLGQQVATPNAHNATFVLGALENLSGSEALLTLRGRGVTDRPFERVNDIRRESEQRFRDKEQGLTAKLKDVQEQLAKVERQTEGGEVILTDKDRATIEKFRGELLSTRRELRDVKLALRQDIDRLDGWLKFLNIAGVPLLIGLAGLYYSARRRRPVAL
jgi:ABC-type uncharacterized transport system involved in gliding motility auxiliary subunit